MLLGGGPQPWFVGPFTNFGGDTSGIFPPGGYSTGVDIYLDVAYAMTHLDTRFDWSSEINDTSGNFRRDFVFNVGTDATGFVITGGNNATRCGADPYSVDPTHGPQVHITQPGWYTFKHTFTGAPDTPLVVNMELIQKSTGVVLGTWTRMDPSDIIGETVGGNGDGWFVQNEFNGLAIDNTYRTGAMSTPLCTTDITNGGWITATNTDKASFGGNAKVDSDSNASGQEEYQDHGPLQPIIVNSIAVSSVYCTNDRTKATILGTATVNGSGMHEFEIDVTDNGQSGANDKYRMFIPDIGYDSGDHTLGGGNITIH